MEAGKQQAKPTTSNLPEIQPAFKNLDIAQLMQGKTLTVGNLLEWQRSVIQAVENAKSNSVISIIPATSVTPVTQPPKITKAPTTRSDTAVSIAENSFAGFKNVQQYIQQCNNDIPFQSDATIKKYVPTPRPIKASTSNALPVSEAPSQLGSTTKVATSVIRGGTTNAEKPAVPLVPNVQIPVSLANQAMLSSMISIASSLVHSAVNNNEEAAAAKPTENVVRMKSPEIIRMRSPELVPVKSPESAPAKSPELAPSLSQIVAAKQATGTIPSTSQTTTNTAATTTTAAADTSQSDVQQTPPKPLFNLSGRTLVTVLPRGSGDSKTTSSHKVFADDTFQPLDSFTVNTSEMGSPPAASSAAVVAADKAVPKPTSKNTSSDSSNVNKNNNNSASVIVKQEVESVYNEDSARPMRKNKGKMSSRGRVIKTGAAVYAENSDFEDDDVFVNNYKQKSSGKSKRASVKVEADSESDYDSIANHTAANESIPLYSVHMTSSGTWFHQVMWDGYRVTIMVPNKDDPYFTPPKDDPPVMFDGEPASSYSSLWKGYAILSEIRNKLFSSFSTAAVVSFRYRSGMETIRVPLLWVPILRNLGSLQESGPSAKVLRMDHLRYLCKHYELKFMDELNQVCQNKVKDTNRTVIELNDSKSDDLDYDKIPVCGFYCDFGGKKKKKSVPSLSALPVQQSASSRKHSRSGDERSSRQKLACMDCQAVFFSDLTSCTYCDSELKKITPDQAKNCLNCGEMIRKRCRKCPFCHYNYGIFTFGRWLCAHCGRCNTARTPACLGCGVEKPAGKGGFTEDQITPIKAPPASSRTSSKLSTSSTHSSPPRTTLDSGTQSPVSGGSLEASPPPKKRARRGLTSVSQPTASEDVIPMDVSSNEDVSDTYLIRNIKWGSAADEVTVVVKIGGQCMVCFPEICEKIMLDHTTEVLTKKVNTLKIKLLDGTTVMTRKKGLQTPHVHDTASRSCQLIQYQDLLLLLKAFNYKVPESFEKSVKSLENEAFYAELKNEIQKGEDDKPTELDYPEDKELIEYWTALHQTVDADQIYQALTTTLKKSNEHLDSINATSNVINSQLEAVQRERKAKRSLCEVLSSEIGFLRRRSLNVMEALVQINQSELEEKTKCAN